MVKNIYLDNKINFLWCQGAELHPEVTLDPVVCFVVGVGVQWVVLKPVPINSAWSKTYIWTLRSTFYDARKLSYTLSQISQISGTFTGLPSNFLTSKNWWTLLSALLLVLMYIGSKGYHDQLIIGSHRITPDTAAHMIPGPGQPQSSTHLNQTIWKTNPREPEKPEQPTKQTATQTHRHSQPSGQTHTLWTMLCNQVFSYHSTSFFASFV